MLTTVSNLAGFYHQFQGFVRGTPCSSSVCSPHNESIIPSQIEDATLIHI